MSSGFFRLKMKDIDSFYDTRIMEHADIDAYFEAFDKSVNSNGSFVLKLMSKAQISVPTKNIEYLMYIPESLLEAKNEE